MYIEQTDRERIESSSVQGLQPAQFADPTNANGFARKIPDCNVRATL
jgi:hypothetical protein